MINFYLKNSAFRGYAQSFRANINYVDLDILYRDARISIYNLLNLSTSLRLRFLICINILFSKELNQNEKIYHEFYFCSRAERILSKFQIFSAIDSAFEKIRNSVDTFISHGSGWSIENITHIDINIGNYRPLFAGCGNFKLPQKLRKKRALINVKCKLNQCFLYAVLAKLYPVSVNACYSSHYKKYLSRIRYDFLKFPVTIDQIPNFEKKNNLQISVYGYDEDIFPIYNGKNNTTKIQLLLYKKHFFTIRNFNKLLHSEKYIHHYCLNCLSGFKKKHTLKSHELICLNFTPQKVTMPTIEKNILKFENTDKKSKHTFVCYADFETVLKPVSSSQPCPQKSYTQRIESHMAISYGLIVLGLNDEIIYSTNYIGLDAVSHFLRTLKKISFKLINVIRDIAPMSYVESFEYNKCCLCKKDFLATDRKCRHHSHAFGNIIGLAHNKCNLAYRNKAFFPVVIHNLKGYDSHLILKELGPDFCNNISIIPVNTQKFNTFRIDQIKFIDSFNFLSSSLSTLVQNLNDSNYEFPIFNSFYRNEKNRFLLKQKSFFPYSYLTDSNVLNEKYLPPRDCFYNTLTNEHISEADYDHVKLVFKAFKCRTFKDYLSLYQMSDVVLLSEVFTSYRNMILKNYNLDPVYFVSSADLSWNCGLLISKAELQLFTDVTMYIFLESQIRGGICLLGKRHSIANNPYIPDTFDPTREHSYILTLDAINLYGKCLSEQLPIGHFKWLNKEEINNFNIFDYGKTSDRGFFLEVDLIYPPRLHNKHNCLPLAANHIQITYEMLSSYQKALLEKSNINFVRNNRKLVPNFYEKKHYVTHYLALQFYIQQGLIVKKIHRILCFRQEAWIKKYVELNTVKRQNASNMSEKSLFKQMTNSFFGRTLMNTRKRINIQGAFTVDQCRKKLNSPLLEYFENVNENFTLFKMKKKNVLLNKPIYTGFTVLELSKIHIYTLFYCHFQKQYGENCELLYTDTDSLYLEIRAKDVYKDLSNIFSDIMDLSNFPNDHFLYSTQNAGKLGALKCESTVPIREFVGLKSKMYACFYADEIKKTAKGVKKQTLLNIRGEIYKNVLYEESVLRHQQTNIISKHHELSTVIQNKISLSCFYDKKYLLDSLHSLAYGHFSIK